MAAQDPKVVKLRPKVACPTCRKPASQEDYPFCSDRCRQVDLNRWLVGTYAVPAVEEDDPETGDDGL